jgi:hypothetical protein
VHESLPNLPADVLHIYLAVLRDSVLDWLGDDEHELEVIFSVSDRNRIEKILKESGRIESGSENS